jgi:formate hydrogenlyase subunit 3/multisubunit Na+/H+ antiporter MnhD subunit
VVPTVFLRGPSKATRELLAPVFSRYFNTFLIQIVSSFAPMPIKAPLVAVFSLIQSAYEATVCAARFGLIDKFPSMFEIVLNMDWTSMLVVLVVLLILAFYSMGKNTVKNLLRMVGFSMPANGIEDGDGDDDDETRKEWAVFGPNVKKRW